MRSFKLTDEQMAGMDQEPNPERFIGAQMDLNDFLLDLEVKHGTGAVLLAMSAVLGSSVARSMQYHTENTHEGLKVFVQKMLDGADGALTAHKQGMID